MYQECCGFDINLLVIVCAIKRGRCKKHAMMFHRVFKVNNCVIFFQYWNMCYNKCVTSACDKFKHAFIDSYFGESQLLTVYFLSAYSKVIVFFFLENCK